ncbi:SusC/RagA family TonB-linked outer membrane protein [Viscerimonas tarda]
MKHKYKFLLLATGLLCLSELSAQTINVAGKLTDAYGNPSGGAGVRILNSKMDIEPVAKDGTFTIQAGIGDYLEIETSDFKKKTVQVTDTFLLVTITGKDALINSGKDIFIPQFESTAAVSSFSSEQIMKSSALNPANAFYGLASGLTVLQNGGTEWDNDPTMYIRGLGGLSGNSEILILVDGFERPLNGLVRDDIESVQVLKDAAATALYGLRGANGVIVVNTKKGKYNDMEISVSYDHAFTSPVRLPKFVNAYTYAKAMNEARGYDGLDPMYNEYALGQFQSGDSPYLYPNVDWVNEMFRDHGASNIYNVSIRGGSSKARYYGNLNMQNNYGFLKPASIYEDYNTQMLYSKMNGRINLDINVTPTTDFIVRMNGNIAERNYPGNNYSDLINYVYTVPSAAFPIRTESGNWGASDIWPTNPIARVAASGNTINHTRSLSSDAELKQRLSAFVEGLSISAKIGYDNYSNLFESTTRNYAYETTNITYDVAGLPANVQHSVQGKNETVPFSKDINTQWRRFSMEARANYNRVWEKSKLDAAFVYSLEDYVIPGQNNTYNRMHYGVLAHYGYLNRYFVDGVFSVSGSNQLPPSNKFGYFPGISGAWVASEEAFLKDIDFIDFLKVRASWGMTGLDNRPGANLYRQTFGSGTGYLFDASDNTSSGMKENRYPSLNMTYEKAYKTNVGVDISVFKKLNFTIDAFLEQRRDILVLAYGTLSSALGQDLPYNNVGAVDNKGIDVGLNFGDQSKDFKYRIAGNFAFARSKVIESGEEYKPDEYSREKGRPVGQIFGYVADGYYTQADLDNPNTPANALYKDLAPGDIKFKDKNEDGIINEYDRTYIGYNSTCPEIYYSASINLEYKGFGIDALIQGVTNYTAQLNLVSMYRPLYGNTTLSEYYYNNRWTIETPNARFPRLTTLDNTNNNAMNTVWLADRSFLKLRHCEVYYKFSNHWLKHTLGLQNMKVYLRGMDLLTISNIKETDPEIIVSGYPAASSINVGLSLNF